MANSVLVIADSGTGKSTSIRTLDPKETFIINIANKPLPFKGWKSKYTQITKDNPKVILPQLLLLLVLLRQCVM